MGGKKGKCSGQKKREKKDIICILEHIYAVFSNWREKFRHNIQNIKFTRYNRSSNI